MSTERLPTVQLGSHGPRVGAQGLGCMGMSEFYGPSDEAESRATLDAALELGVTLFDTADMYGSGHNEEFIGPFVRANRDQVVLATKFGVVRRPDDPQARAVRNDPEYIRSAVDGSLRRLGVDVIDLYYAHRRDPSVPIEETVGAMAELITQGKVRYLGLSEVTGDELRAAHAVHPITALQSEWSLFNRDVEISSVAAAADLGVALVPYSPLGRGFLTGTFTEPVTNLPEGDARGIFPQFVGDNAKANVALLAPVRDIATARGITPAQVALAWVHQRSQVHQLTVVPIPGTRRRSRLAENVAAAGITLSDEELAALEPIASKVAGDRYMDMSSTATAREDGAV